MKFSKGEYAMELWEDFLKFMDRVVQWLKYLFTGEVNSENGKWPPDDYPGIDD